MSKSPLTILYVEDEPNSRKVMELIIRGIDFAKVVLFSDSTDFIARALALDPSPDVIFLDIHVSPHSGFEMLDMLRQSDALRNARVVAMTASVMNEEVRQLQSAGFDGCLAKPLDMDTFPETLDCIVAGEPVWRVNS